jgi:tight adherence protein C
MILTIVIALIFLAVSVITYVVLWLPRREAQMARSRLDDLISLKVTRDDDRDIGGKDESAGTAKERGLRRLLSLFSLLSKKDREEYSKLRLSLMRAGYYEENSVKTYMSLRTLLVFIFLGAGFVVVFFGTRSVPPLYLVMLLMLMPLLGYFLPAVVLSLKMQERQEEIAKGLPDALDFMVVCVEAGLGLNAALVRVGKELGLRSRALGEELVLVNQEMRAGVAREQALRHLSQRNTIGDLKIVVAALVLADRLGTSIADTLRAQSDSLRTRVRQRTEERAAKSGIKLLFPLVFMILPTLFIVILGPAVILGVRALQSMVHH